MVNCPACLRPITAGSVSAVGKLWHNEWSAFFFFEADFVVSVLSFHPLPIDRACMVVCLLICASSFACKRCGLRLNPSTFKQIKGQNYCPECVDKNANLYQSHKKEAKSKPAPNRSPPPSDSAPTPQALQPQRATAPCPKCQTEGIPTKFCTSCGTQLPPSSSASKKTGGCTIL